MPIFQRYIIAGLSVPFFLYGGFPYLCAVFYINEYVGYVCFLCDCGNPVH